MKMRILAAATWLCVATLAPKATATVGEFTLVDQNRFDDSYASLNNFNGSRFGGFQFTAQNNDSLSNQPGFAGTLKTDLRRQEAIFPGGSRISLQPTSSMQEPGVGGAAGSAAANFGATLFVPLGVGHFAVRDLAFDLTGQASYTEPPQPASELTLTFLSGSIDYDIRSDLFAARTGTLSLAGRTTMFDASFFRTFGAFGPNPPFNVVTALNLHGTFALPVDFTMPGDTALSIEANIATNFLPIEFLEPATIGLLAPAIAMSLRRKRQNGMN